MEIFEAFRYRLDPRPAQTAGFFSTAGAVRFVWNWALQQRRVSGAVNWESRPFRAEWFNIVVAALLLGNGLPNAVRAEEAAPDAPPPAPPARSVFEAPMVDAHRARVYQQVQQLTAQRRLAEAEQALLQAMTVPEMQTALTHYYLAGVRAVLGKADDALVSLANAVDLGFADAAQIRDSPDFAGLRDRPRFQALVALAGSRPVPQGAPAVPEPKPIRDGVAGITDANTVWSPQRRCFFVFHAQPDGAGDPVLLLYDNRDRGHSRMDLDGFPRIAALVYDEPARRIGLDSNAQTAFLHNMPTLGNASQAEVRERGGVKNPFWRSISRGLYQTGQTAHVLADQYANNHLYPK